MRSMKCQCRKLFGQPLPNVEEVEGEEEGEREGSTKNTQGPATSDIYASQVVQGIPSLRWRPLLRISENVVFELFLFCLYFA